MSKEILCTLGPASMNEHVIARLEDLGVSLFRINMSHTRLEEVADTIRFITSLTDVPLSLDTEGAQIRTGDLSEPAFQIHENNIVRAHRQPMTGDGENFNFYPNDIISAFRVGDLISIDFNAVLVQVIESGDEIVSMRVLNGGMFGRNKAVTVDRPISLSPLTEKDKAAVQIGIDMDIRHFALSFANSGDDVDILRNLVGKEACIISKIESRNGVENLDDIAERSEALLIDRGDLSREIPIELIPSYQKSIINRAKSHDLRVYVATNLLESMVTEPVPTRAEINDIYNTFLDGADGIVLAAETAIGKYPVRCANMVSQMITVFENRDHDVGDHYHLDPVSLLVKPHGGELVHREASAADLKTLGGLPELRVSITDLMDCEQFALGAYSPLKGFMDQETMNSVLAEYRLPEGTTWTMPVILQVTAEAVDGFGPGERVVLTFGDGKIHAFLDVSQIFPLALDRVANQWFGTDSTDHPGVQWLFSGGELAIAGPVTLVDYLPSLWRHFQLSPAQTRFIFTQKGWSRVVGFHGRNPPHRAHEHIQMQSLALTNADGLYISPVIGPKLPGDFLPGPIMKSYQVLLDQDVYPKGKAVLGSFATYSRFCGPREAVFTAICRKNMGCSHFIVGCEHTGVGTFYEPDGNREIFARLGEIGITPVFFDAIGYDQKSKAYRSALKGGDVEPISGHQIRESLRKGIGIPDWLMRESVQEILLDDIAAGEAVFFEGTR